MHVLVQVKPRILLSQPRNYGSQRTVTMEMHSTLDSAVCLKIIMDFLYRGHGSMMPSGHGAECFSSHDCMDNCPLFIRREHPIYFLFLLALFQQRQQQQTC